MQILSIVNEDYNINKFMLERFLKTKQFAKISNSQCFNFFENFNLNIEFFKFPFFSFLK